MFVKLRDLRTSKNISAERMAEVIGLKTKAAYYKKECGRIKMTLEEAKKISDFLKISVDDIFFDNNVSEIETREEVLQ